MPSVTASAAEAARPMAGDDRIPGAMESVTRAVSIAAPAEDVFPWLTQMGFGRAGWYSHDLIDNLGRPSARHLEPDWQVREVGATVPGGPLDFRVAAIDAPRVFVIELADPTRVAFTLAFEVVPTDGGCRLLSRARFSIHAPAGRLAARWLLRPGDGIMVRRQLRGIRERAEAARARDASADDGRLCP